MQNGPITKNGVLPVTTLFFKFFLLNFLSVQEPLIKSWSDVPKTQMSTFILFVSAEVLFDGGFSLWVSLSGGPSGYYFNETELSYCVFTGLKVI